MNVPFKSKFQQNFKPIKVLGQGAYGIVIEVVEAVLDELECRYAIKRIPIAKMETGRNVAMREVQALATFDHPGIVRFYYAWKEEPPPGWQREYDSELFEHLKYKCVEEVRYREDSAFLYIKMELCQSTLKEWLSSNISRNLYTMKKWFKQIVSAVEYIHKMKRIHRDLKPSNIFFAGGDRLKVGDLGIITDEDNADSKQNADLNGSGDSRTYNMCTKKYMAPEQSGFSNYSNKVDVFALGLIFAELCVVLADADAEMAFDDYRRGTKPKILHQLPEVDRVVSWMANRNEMNRPTCLEICAHPFFVKDVAVVRPFLEYAKSKRAFPLISVASASSYTDQEQKERIQEIRRRINLSLKGSLQGRISPMIIPRNDDDLNEISCLHWNCGGVLERTALDDTSLLDLIFALEPDVILLNEVMAMKYEMSAVMNVLNGYSYLSTPSYGLIGRCMRGSAIIYRNAYKILWTGQETWPEKAEKGEAPAIEAIAVDIQTSAGKQFRLITSYVQSEWHFNGAEKLYKKLSSDSSPTIITGDLNMLKEKFVKKWAESGFVDTLNPSWHTSKHMNMLMSIDYVMHNGKTSPLVCHKPIQPDEGSIHFPIPFTVGGSSSGSGYCTDIACKFGCGK